MKKLVVFAMVAMSLTIFNGCQKDEFVPILDDKYQEAVKPDVYVENGYLVFKSKEVYDSIRFIIEKYEPEEAIEWEKSLNFTSAKSERYFAELEANEIVSEEDVKDFKKRYSRSFDISDELDLNYKFYASSLGAILNIDGEVKIGSSLYKFAGKEYIVLDGDYKKLKTIDNELKSGSLSDDLIIIFDPNPKSKLKSTDVITSGSFQIYNYRKLDYRVEKIVYSSFAGIDYMNTGQYMYLEGYELNLVMRQYEWAGLFTKKWRTMRASYSVWDSSINWQPSGSLTAITNTFSDVNVGLTTNEVYIKFLDYEIRTFGTPSNPYFWVFNFKTTFCSSGIGWENAISLDLGYF